MVGIYIYQNDYNLRGSNWAGKLCTVVMDTVLLIFIAFDNIPEALAIVLVGIVIVVLLTSFAVYLSQYKKLYDEHIKKKKA